METLLIAADRRPRQSLLEALKRHKHQVRVVGGADAACTALRSGDYRMVVLEVEGFGEEGPLLCRRLRAIRPDCRCPILAAGESPRPEQLEALLAAGADDYLTDLDDAERLEVRLTVAEHRLGAAAGHPETHSPTHHVGINCCPLLYYAPYGASRSGVNGEFLEVNPALVAMLGYDSEQELLAADLAADVYRDPNVRSRLMAAAGDHLGVVELQWKRKDGTPITVRAHGRVVRDATGKVVELEGIVEDITQQKQTEEALKESEQRFRAVVDNAVDGILVADVETKELCLANQAICRMLGYRGEEIGRLKAKDLHRAEDLPYAMRHFDQQARGEYTLGKDIPMKRRDGSVFCADINSFPITLAGKALLAGIFRDVTQRNRAEQALRESETKLRGLFENLPDFLIIVDRGATIQLVNRGAPGATPQELVGADGFGFIAPDYQPQCREAFDQVLSTRQTQSVEAQDVFGHSWACRLVPVIEQNEVRNVMIICTDFTEQKKSTEALQKEQRLLRHLLDLHERDRQLTAYEIHDGFSQYLTGALYNLQGFRESQAKNPLEAWKTFDAGLSLIRRSINEARRLIGGLRPPILDESGIVAAIDYLACETAESQKMEVEFIHDVKFQRLAPPLESAIFRIVQESLTNARRHSQSEKIRIELLQHDACLRIGVRDWGIGFDSAKVSEGRFGLQGLRERARLFGGQVTIETAPGKGTFVSVELPLIEPAQ